MADSNTTSRSNDHPAQKPKTIVGKILDLICRIIGVLIFSAIISVVIEWIGMIFFYPDAGHEHAKMMMQKEVSYLSGSLNPNDLENEAITTANNTVTDLISFLFIDSGVITSLNSVKVASADDSKFLSLFKGLGREYYDYMMAAVFIVIMFLVRLSILILSIPAFLLFGAVGVCDGLMQRDLRRWCGGNESGFIYHWAKRFALPILIASWIIYLAIPSTIHPNYIITPFAVLFGLVLMVMTSKFKKYL